MKKYNKISDLANDVINNHMVRKSKKQKDDFINLIINNIDKSYVENIKNNRNIIVGDLNNAEYVFSAHYDTCATLFILPNFITPKNKLIFIIYQVILTLILSLIAMIPAIPVAYFTDNFNYGLYTFSGTLLLMCFQMMYGISNKNNYNDNTSGVITLLELYYNLSVEERNKVCFVFFDNEEKGLLGSKAFKGKHKEIMNTKILVNFDCVSDGDNILLIHNNIDDKLNALEKSLVKNNKNIEITPKKGCVYPSDQRNFKKYIAVAAFKKNKFLGYYMNRIHTYKDVMFDEENIICLKETFKNLINN